MTNYYIHLIDIKETTTHKGIGPQKKTETPPSQLAKYTRVVFLCLFPGL